VKQLTATQVAAITDDLIVSAVGQDHRLIDANGAWNSALGWKEEDLLGSDLKKFVAPGDRPRVDQALRNVNGDVTELRLDMIGPSGMKTVAWRFCLHNGDLYGVGRVVCSDEIESRVNNLLERHERKADHFEVAAATASMSETKARTWKTWLTAGLLAASTSVGALAWAVNKIESGVVQAHQSTIRKAKVDGAIGVLEVRADESDQKFNRLGGVLIETQVQVSDSIGYIVSKIEAVHPRTTVSVREPPTVEKMRTKVEAIKKKKQIDKLFEFDEDSPSDPFAGLEDKGLP
jgi:PAS domain-containing protein